jgi:hypothetical protein
MNIDYYNAGREAAHGPWSIGLRGLNRLADARAMQSLRPCPENAVQPPSYSAAATEQSHNSQDTSWERRT